MVSPNDYTISATNKFKNLSLLNDDDDTLRHKFVTIGDTTFIAISKELLKKFNIDEKTWAYQHATENGIYISFRDTKNKVVGNFQEANNQDYGE